jgi:hypothetical protein
MHFADVCAAYPGQWLVVEAIEAHTEVRGDACRRILDQLEILEVCADGCAAKHRYRELRRAMPGKALCYLHTSYPALEFEAEAALLSA